MRVQPERPAKGSTAARSAWFSLVSRASRYPGDVRRSRSCTCIVPHERLVGCSSLPTLLPPFLTPFFAIHNPFWSGNCSARIHGETNRSEEEEDGGEGDGREARSRGPEGW